MIKPKFYEDGVWKQTAAVKESGGVDPIIWQTARLRHYPRVPGTHTLTHTQSHTQTLKHIQKDFPHIIFIVYGLLSLLVNSKITPPPLLT